MNSSKKDKIEARILKGFRDELPGDAQERDHLFRSITNIFELSGFSPIDTPALEYTEILLGKGSDETDKQLFRFQDQGGRDIALRFDLTVPLARYVSMHQNELLFPFKRYHIAPVWRAEKPQKGRYREFYQCDFDIIGSKALISDLEILLVVHRFFSSISMPYRVRINHRGLLNGILASFGVEGKITEALRTIDKLEKLGREVVIRELIETADISTKNAESLTQFIYDLKEQSDPGTILGLTKQKCPNNDLLDSSILRVESIFQGLQYAGIPSDASQLDISIARGLDYYTGLVFETQLSEMPSLGSVCSGGRYDNLASLFTNKELPGVGGSIGIDRLLVALREKGHSTGTDTHTKVLVSILDEKYFSTYLSITQQLRDHGIATEIYPEAAKLGAQLKFADKKRIPLVVILGENEFEKNEVQIKDLRSLEGSPGQHVCGIDTLSGAIKNLLK
jgi:histidyl-tRNA synthetase